MAVILVSLLFGGIAGILAHYKARNALGWFIAGCLIGPFSLLVVLLPMAVKPGLTRRCSHCLEVIRSQARVCKHCQSVQEEIRAT